MVSAALAPTQEPQSTPAQASVLRWLVAIGSVTETVMAGFGAVPAEPVTLVLVAGPPSETASLSSSPCQPPGDRELNDGHIEYCECSRYFGYCEYSLG
jgi:hypothetical protein